MKQKGIWILLFAGLVVLLGVLGTYWNVLLVEDYFQKLEMAKRFENLNFSSSWKESPWSSVAWGSVGFIAALTAVILFFVRLLKEMKLNQIQRDFLAQVTHELKSPLATLELTSTLLQDETVTQEEANQFWKLHHEELQRLKREVSDLLLSSQLESQKWKIKLQTQKLKEWFQEYFNKYQYLLGDQAQVKFEGSWSSALISMDSRLSDLIFQNLLGNIKKFSQGSPELTIRYGVSIHKKKKWWIEFEDRGLGFSPRECKKIFGRFYRSVHSFQRAVPGNGLGLFLTKRACLAQQMKISARSDGPFKGAVFRIEGRGV